MAPIHPNDGVDLEKIEKQIELRELDKLREQLEADERLEELRWKKSRELGETPAQKCAREVNEWLEGKKVDDDSSTVFTPDIS